jgi:carbon storage regulator CsrA
MSWLLSEKIISERYYMSRQKPQKGKDQRKETEMLVLSRKKDETIIMRIPGHEDIRLTVVRIDNLNKVRIGVEADKDVVILRQELDVKPEISRAK